MGVQATDQTGELTEAAKTWQSGLMGITPQQLGNGLKRLLISDDDWSPSLIKFRKMCLHRDDIPTIEEMAQILTKAARTDGSIVFRYQHSLAFAIAQSRAFDSYDYRFLSAKKCEGYIKPIYDRLLRDGWDEFKPEHYEDQKALSHKHQVSINRDDALRRFAELKELLRDKADEKTQDQLKSERANMLKAKALEAVARLREQQP